MKLRQTLGGESARPVVNAAVRRAHDLHETVRDPWPNDRSLSVPEDDFKESVAKLASKSDSIPKSVRAMSGVPRAISSPAHRKFRVAVVVTHTVEIDVEAGHNRAAAHAAVDKLRTAEIRIGGDRQEISSMEIVTTKAHEID